MGDKKCPNITFLHQVKGQQRDELASSLAELSAECLALLHTKLSRLSSEKSSNTTEKDGAAQIGEMEIVWRQGPRGSSQTQTQRRKFNREDKWRGERFAVCILPGG